MNLLFPPGTLFIVFSIYVSLVLAILPLGDWIDVLRPSWVLLVVLYWVKALPSYCGIWFTWSIGIFCDLILSKSFGTHSLALTVVIFLHITFHRQIKVFSTFQQMLVVMIFSALYLLIIRIVDLFFGNTGIIGISYWLPVFINALLWPWFHFLMDGFKTRLGIYETNQ